MIDTCTYPAVLTYEVHGQKRVIAFPTSCLDVHETADQFVCMVGCLGFYPGQLEDAIRERIGDIEVPKAFARPDSVSYDPSFPFAMKVWLGHDRGCTTLWWPEELDDDEVIPCLNAHFGSFDKFEWLGGGIPVEDAYAFTDWVCTNYVRVQGHYLAKDESTDTPFDVEDLHRIYLKES
jgi:hypothetical protein